MRGYYSCTGHIKRPSNKKKPWKPKLGDKYWKLYNQILPNCGVVCKYFDEICDTLLKKQIKTLERLIFKEDKKGGVPAKYTAKDYLRALFVKSQYGYTYRQVVDIVKRLCYNCPSYGWLCTMAGKLGGKEGLKIVSKIIRILGQKIGTKARCSVSNISVMTDGTGFSCRNYYDGHIRDHVKLLVISCHIKKKGLLWMLAAKAGKAYSPDPLMAKQVFREDSLPRFVSGADFLADKAFDDSNIFKYAYDYNMTPHIKLKDMGEIRSKWRKKGNRDFRKKKYRDRGVTEVCFAPKVLKRFEPLWYKKDETRFLFGYMYCLNWLVRYWILLNKISK